MPFHVDHVADKNGVELVQLAKRYEFPAFVKRADMARTMNPPDAAKSYYADLPRKQFPCHTKAATWLSALYYQEKRAEFHPKDRTRIEHLLDSYVDYWQIRPDVDAMRSRWANLHKNADDHLPDSSFAYVRVDDTTGRRERHLPLRSAAEVKAAAEWLHTYRDRIPLSDRRAIARRVLEKSSSYGASVGGHREFLNRQAGRGICNPADVSNMIEGRASLLKDAELRDQFRKMAITVKSSPGKALNPVMLCKLADTMDTLDRILGLTTRYDRDLSRPEDVIFNVTLEKAAEDLHAHVATTSGKLYEKEALGRLSVEDVRALFGPAFAARVAVGDIIDPEKMAEEVATLPRPDAALLEGLLSEHGVTPVLQKAASARQGLTDEELAAWEAAYRAAE